jgi:Lon protease-like protein
MTAVLADLPIFALNTVLFPDGLLPLRVFEARYLDMARDCLRADKPFGVCLLKSGSEIAEPGQSVVPESVGCLARIVDCDVQQHGILLLRTRGTQRFKVLSQRIEPSGLMLAMAEPIAADARPDPDAGDNAEQWVRLAACSEVLERIIATQTERDPANLPFIEPFRLDDPTWVSNRLAEILPISLRARQKMMALEDALARLDIVHQYMRQHQLL